MLGAADWAQENVFCDTRPSPPGFPFALWEQNNVCSRKTAAERARDWPVPSHQGNPLASWGLWKTGKPKACI